MRRKSRKNGEAPASPASQAGFSDRGPDGRHTTPRLPYTQNGDGWDGKDDDSRLVIGYVRVSTEDQADNGISLEDQKTRIKAYATAHGLELVRIASDKGVSGKTISRRRGLRGALQRGPSVPT